MDPGMVRSEVPGGFSPGMLTPNVHKYLCYIL